MASVLVLAFCSALIIALILLIFYVLCLFRSMNQFTRSSSIATIYQQVDSKNFISPENEEETETSTIVFDLPLDKWRDSRLSSNGKIMEKMTAEEMSFFQLPSRDNWSYYKFSIVDELSNGSVLTGGGGGESNSVKSDGQRQVEWIGSRRSRQRHHKPQQFGRKNTWDMLRIWMDGGRLETVTKSEDWGEMRNNTVIPDIRIERLSLSDSDSMLDEKELLI